MEHPHINSGVYVLRLEGGKFYVGESEDIYERVNNHSSAWTKEHRPIEIEEVFPAKEDLKQLEKEVTLMYMRRKGWRNVRGYAWTKRGMDRPPVPLRGKAVA